jgi:hypothetical protein
MVKQNRKEEPKQQQQNSNDKNESNKPCTQITSKDQNESSRPACHVKWIKKKIHIKNVFPFGLVAGVKCRHQNGQSVGQPSQSKKKKSLRIENH